MVINLFIKAHSWVYPVGLSKAKPKPVFSDNNLMLRVLVALLTSELCLGNRCQNNTWKVPVCILLKPLVVSRRDTL